MVRMVRPDGEGPDGEAWRVMVVRGCDVALPALLIWQSWEAARPATTVAVGLVVALRGAALTQPGRRR